MSFLNEAIAGEYNHEGEAIVYGDTDSCYFTAWPAIKADVEAGNMHWNKETAVQLYDHLGEKVNGSFPAFMEQAFHCPRNKGEIIRAGRELVADRGLFITKKRYAVNIYDKEGKRKDTNGKRGDIKAMGLDLKRADTPKYVQEFLMEVLKKTLHGDTRDDILHHIKEFKRSLINRPSFEKGSPKSANNLTNYANEAKKAGSISNRLFNDTDSDGKINMPGHVRAALNWNYLRKINGDQHSMKIMDGMKVIVCKLRDNPLNFTSIAYPTDELRLPQWFLDLPFDDEAMENSLVDDKVENLLAVLDWDLAGSLNTRSSFDQLFTFE